MYFKESSEIIEFFNNLEETNLFNIQNAHYAEQKYQELKVKSEQQRYQLHTTFEKDKEQKRQLEKQLSELDIQIKQLKKKKEQNSLLDEKDSKDIKSTIAQEYQGIKDTMHSYIPEIQYNAESLSLLSAIEICMERLWDKLKECYAENPKLIKEIVIHFLLFRKLNSKKRKIIKREKKLPKQTKSKKKRGKIEILKRNSLHKKCN